MDAPSQDFSRWVEIGQWQGDIQLSRSTQLKTFAYVSPTEFSVEEKYDYVLKCPQPRLSIAPGAYATLPQHISLYSNEWPSDAYHIYYTSDGSDPFTSPSTQEWIFFDDEIPPLNTPALVLDADHPNIHVRAYLQREGWAASDILDAQYSIDYRQVGMVFIADLPDGTTISFQGLSPALRYNLDSMLVSAQPAGLPAYEWSLNGASFGPASSASSIQVGASGPMGLLDVGNYTLSCIAYDSQGFAYSESCSFSVIP